MNEVEGTLRLSRERFIADIAAAIKVEPTHLTDAFKPFDAGLDSIRFMILIESWRKQGLMLSFAELAERPSLGDWWSLASTRMSMG